MSTYCFAYGHGTKEFEYNEADILKVVRTKDFTPMQDVEHQVLQAVENPIGSPLCRKLSNPEIP